LSANDELHIALRPRPEQSLNFQRFRILLTIDLVILPFNIIIKEMLERLLCVWMIFAKRLGFVNPPALETTRQNFLPRASRHIACRLRQEILASESSPVILTMDLSAS